MKITIITIGTQGDVQPYVALGLGLQGAGHQVRIATSANFESFVRGYGLDFYPVSGDIQAAMRNDHARSAMERGGTPLSAIRMLTRQTGDLLEQLMTESWMACEGTEAVIGSLLGLFAGQPIAQKLNVPYISAYLQPTARTRAFPNAFSLFPNLPDWLAFSRSPYNWVTHAITGNLFWLLFRTTLNKARAAALHMPPVSAKERYPVLYGYSPSVLPKPGDWNDRLHVTGYWFLNHSEDWRPSPELVDFLESGPPPVYVGFGSIAGRQPEQMTELVVEALAASQQRGVLMTGWGGLANARLPETVFTLESAPHDWLFPRMAAVVHHGGAGTVAAGLRAGVPQVIVPSIADQIFWGQQVARLQIGPKPVKRKVLSAESLAAAIASATNSPAMRAQAARMGEQIRAEDGVATATQVFNQWITSTNFRHAAVQLRSIPWDCSLNRKWNRNSL